MVMILTSLPSVEQAGDLLARGAHDAGIEAAGQAAIGGRHDDQMASVLAGAGQQQRRDGPDTPAARLAITSAMRVA